jgi:glyoxylase-like metal-dependent hydrolase (beta-lactamase superfamily II)
LIVECSTHPQFLSNTYLVADGRGGPAFFVDAGGPVAPLIEAAERRGLSPAHVLLTHHHFDHVSEVSALRAHWPGLDVRISASERELLEGAQQTGADGSDEAESPSGPGEHAKRGRATTIEAGEALQVGDLEVRPLHTPGHTAGMLSFLVCDRAESLQDSAAGEEGVPGARARPSFGGGPGGFAGGRAVVFTGDTLFKDSVGGVKAPGHTTYADLRDSIMGTLMELPAETVIYPGHADATSVAREWEHNPFIRIWRGLDAEGIEHCTALGRDATLVLLGSDYDGGTKAWVRWPDGSDDIIPGSRVQQKQ